MKALNRGALFTFSLVFVGLVTGFFREILLAFYFGTSRDVEIFRVAFGLPSIFSDSLAISFVSMLIPVLIAGEDRDLLDAKRLVVWASFLLAIFVVVTGLLTMHWQAAFLAPGILGEDREELIVIGRICWGMCFLTLCSLPLRAIMSVRELTWPGAASQSIRSGIFLITLVVLVTISGGTDIMFAGYAALMAGFAVLTIHVVAIGAIDRHNLRNIFISGPKVDTIFPLVTTLSVVFISQVLWNSGRLIDRAIATNIEVGTLAALEYSYAILMAVAMVIGTSTNIIFAPRIGRALKSSQKIPNQYWKIIFGISSVAFFVGIGMSFISSSLVSLVFENGVFTAEDTSLTARIMSLHLIGLGPLVMVLILTQVLILMRLHKWLIPIAGMKLLVKSIVLYFLLEAEFGLDGIAISLGISESITVLMLLVLIKRSS
ncbi:hypothetical protein F9L33_15610 [Amylibacter sp. SFDW26]|uniref:lipid II flippase MurJ n=1 Tax=Amylibacter sp. SFDW26 TaxID=2652722 RepID=UPI0012618E34|nr:lipid II flippase MurJ [Amylibacter sp. SFDW26]KAB7609846.1 hypothetical protein F9L33_15610 [Amylibacter sp. SFDW26]